VKQSLKKRPFQSQNVNNTTTKKSGAKKHLEASSSVNKKSDLTKEKEKNGDVKKGDAKKGDVKSSVVNTSTTQDVDLNTSTRDAATTRDINNSLVSDLNQSLNSSLRRSSDANNNSIMMNASEFDCLLRRMNEMDTSVTMDRKQSLLFGEDEEIALLQAFE
jgi:hypothetical protein